MALPVWNDNTKHYLFEEKADKKDRIEVEVGDEKDPNEVHPQVKIKRWDNEINASIRLIHDSIKGSVKVNDDGESITWSKKQGKNEWKAVLYHRDDIDSGGFEFELHLPSRPPTDYIQFSLNTKGLVWYKQLPLTEVEREPRWVTVTETEALDENGRVVASRPENVINSYAVYHTNKGISNDSRGKDYKTGKAFHIYRPHVIDANGKETWGDLNIENNILTVSVDGTWLNDAEYPVIVDPTFGYTSVGASGEYLVYNEGTVIVYDNRHGYRFTCPDHASLTDTRVYFEWNIFNNAPTALINAYINEADSAGEGSHDQVASVVPTPTYPTVESRNSGEETSATTSHTINMPSGITAGDLLICVFTCDGGVTTTPPGDWREAWDVSYSTDVTQAIFTKIAEGSDTLTVTTSASEESTHVTFRISGHGGTTSPQSSNGSSTNSDPPTENIYDSLPCLWIATRGGDGTVVATSAPSGYGNMQTVQATNSTGASTNTAERNADTDSENPGTWTSATEQWVCGTICVLPEGNIYKSDGNGWFTFNFSGESLSKNTDYFINYLPCSIASSFDSDTNLSSIKYDSGTSGYSGEDTSGSADYDNPEDPWTPSNTGDKKFSMYATYEITAHDVDISRADSPVQIV